MSLVEAHAPGVRVVEDEAVLADGVGDQLDGAPRLGRAAADDVADLEADARRRHDGGQARQRRGLERRQRVVAAGAGVRAWSGG